MHILALNASNLLISALSVMGRDWSSINANAQRGLRKIALEKSVLSVISYAKLASIQPPIALHVKEIECYRSVFVPNRHSKPLRRSTAKLALHTATTALIGPVAFPVLSQGNSPPIASVQTASMTTTKATVSIAT